MNVGDIEVIRSFLSIRLMDIIVGSPLCFYKLKGKACVQVLLIPFHESHLGACFFFILFQLFWDQVRSVALDGLNLVEKQD